MLARHDDDRDLDTKISDIEAALEQAEAWADDLLALFNATPSVCKKEDRTLVMSVVKTAHWALVKLWRRAPTTSRLSRRTRC